jgi:small subunit ribosomal protein S1
MHNPSSPEFSPANETDENDESFGELLSQYERSHSRKDDKGDRRLEGVVVKVTSDSVLVDIGFKSEGILPLSAFTSGETVKPGDKLSVASKGRGPEGYYELTRGKVRRPTDWAALERAFADKAAILGTITGLVKGGLTVDVGVRAFLPASRSGTRDAAEMEKLVGQEIRCRITKLDVTDEDVVVDRRAVLEEEQQAVKERRYSELKEGDTITGTVRSLTDYGAFVDIGGVDALLHVSDIAWSRVAKASDVLSVGQELEARVLKITSEPGKRRVSIGLKQLQPHPWDAAAEKYRTGERVRGAVTRVMDFGAFVELEPGVEGLIHLSEMSWAKKVRKPNDVVKPGETVEAVILGVNTNDRRISLGLKQALGDPWAEATKKFPAGTVIEGPVVSVTKFGAFVQLTEGIEGMIHVSEMSADKQINHPQDVVRLGQIVKAQVLAIDSEKRQMRLSMKQLIPTGLDEYLAEHKPGDLVTGRVVESSGGEGRVALGEGVFATCRISATSEAGSAQTAAPAAAKADLSSLSSMLQARWKGGASSSGAAVPKGEEVREGQIRSFRIARLDPAQKKIDVELA